MSPSVDERPCGSLTRKLLEQNISKSGHDRLLVLPDAEVLQKPEVDVDELVDAGKDPVDDVHAQVQVLGHPLHEDLKSNLKKCSYLMLYNTTVNQTHLMLRTWVRILTSEIILYCKGH